MLKTTGTLTKGSGLLVNATEEKVVLAVDKDKLEIGEDGKEAPDDTAVELKEIDDVNVRVVGLLGDGFVVD